MSSLSEADRLHIEDMYRAGVGAAGVVGRVTDKDLVGGNPESDVGRQDVDLIPAAVLVLGEDALAADDDCAVVGVHSTQLGPEPEVRIHGVRRDLRRLAPGPGR